MHKSDIKLTISANDEYLADVEAELKVKPIDNALHFSVKRMNGTETTFAITKAALLRMIADSVA